MPPSLHPFTVVANEPVADGLFCLTISSPELAREIRPGQFMNVAVPGDASHVLRVPLSFSRANAPTGTIQLIVAVVGEGTERLSRMPVGSSSTAVGPAGNGWRLPPSQARALLVAGGVGLPPVMAAAGLLSQAGIPFDAIVGARTAGKLPSPCVRELEGLADDVLVASDDGSVGVHGFTTDVMADLLRQRRYASVLTCGPIAMMRGVASLAREAGLACQVSTEQLMGCGFGACSCCNVGLAAGGYALCCQDGPVFNAEVLAW